MAAGSGRRPFRILLARVNRWQGMEVGGVAVEPAEVTLIDRIDVVVDGAIVIAAGEILRQPGW